MSTTLSLIVDSCVTSQGAGGNGGFCGDHMVFRGERKGIRRRQLNTECGQDKIEYK